MALYTSLPVFKLGYDLLIVTHKTTKLFTREHKYTLGEKLKGESLQLLIQVYKANKSKNQIRINDINTGREHIEVMRLLFRIARDLQIISIKTYININIKIESLSKQLTAWQKYTAGAII
ncbi:four helix bundle protein [Thalassobellus citreus]|uniref:four helix bundle protein n=1 Tax=Thalassobellus citreus TaxID=3367752 RepID=UPI003798F8F6